MSKVTAYIEQLVESLTKFPGVGRKGAERIAYFIVRSNKSIAKDLTVSLDNISEKLANCDNCGMIFLKELTLDEFYKHSIELKKLTENS